LEEEGGRVESWDKVGISVESSDEDEDEAWIRRTKWALLGTGEVEVEERGGRLGREVGREVGREAGRKVGREVEGESEGTEDGDGDEDGDGVEEAYGEIGDEYADGS
jgi:hypothetical protein